MGRVLPLKMCGRRRRLAVSTLVCLSHHDWAFSGSSRKGGALQAAEKRLSGRSSERSFGVRQLAAAFPPSQLAGWELKPRCKVLRIVAGESPASKLAGQKAAASCRTPKRAAPAQAAAPLGGCANEFFRSLLSPAENARYKFCSSRAPRSLRLQAARGARPGNMKAAV